MRGLALVLCLLTLWGCRQALGYDELIFGRAQEGGGGTANGGNGGVSGGGGDGGDGGTPLARCASADEVEEPTVGDVLLWSTLDDEASIASPKVGCTGCGSILGTSVFETANDRTGLSFGPQAAFHATWPVAYDTDAFHVDLSSGSIDFCLRPSDQAVDRLWAVVTDGGTPVLWFVGGDVGLLFYWDFDLDGTPDGNYVDGGFTNTSLQPGQWRRLTATWGFPGNSIAIVDVYIDGMEAGGTITAAGPALAPTFQGAGQLLIGGDNNLFTGSADSAHGAIDELVVYRGTIEP